MTRKLPWHLGFSPYPHRMWISLCIAVAFGRKCTGKQHRSATWSKKCQTALFHWNQALARETMCPWSRSEEHTSELQSLMRISYAVFCLKKKNKLIQKQITQHNITCHNHKQPQKNKQLTKQQQT